MKVIVTGATGFIGRSFLDHFALDKNVEILLITRSKADFISTFHNVKVIYEDLNNHDKISALMTRFKPDGIIHLAWIGVYNCNHMAPSQEQNYFIIKNLLESGRENCLKFFIGLGSQAEYGPYITPIKETFEANPTTLYGKFKLKSALYAKRFCLENNIRLVWLRLFSSYGPFDHPSWLIPYVICRCLKGEKILVTKGVQKWDYLYVEDVAAILYKCIYSDIHGIYNLGSGLAIEIREIILKVRDFINPKIDVRFGAIPFKKNQIFHLEADMTLLQKELKYELKFPLDLGLAKTIKYYENL